MRRLLLAALGLVVSLSAAAPQRLGAQAFDWYRYAPYNAAVPRPDSLLGHPLGTRHTMYWEQQGVLDRMIAAAPDRVRTEVIGTTAEGKVMRLLIISSPENLRRLDAIRADLDRLADPRATSSAEARAIAARDPAVVLLTHSIHGNEPAGFESAMMTAYQLLASNAPEVQAILKDVIVLINPSQNPDGHERFAAWYNSVAVGSEEGGALESREPWSIQGRYNHYRFDMNRDVLAMSQAETRALAGVVLRWHPQVSADLHSTTAQYFFPPAALPINGNLPATTPKWLERMGRGNAGAFDRFGWSYYVRDVFDLYYAGYWDSWPSLNGAIGMTFETDGGPELRIRKDDGSVTTFADGIAHHHVAAMATLATTAAGREEMLRDYYDFRASGMAEAQARPFRRVVITPGDDADRARQLVALLGRQGVEVTELTQPLTSLKAHGYAGAGALERRTFPAGSWVVDLAQPQARLATAILEPRSKLDSAFAAAQLDRWRRNQRRGPEATTEGYEFYDVTAWSLPYAFGVEAYWTEDAPALTGRPAATAPAPVGGVSARATSAYVFPNSGENAAKLAMRLMAEGFRLGATSRPMVADGATYPEGTFVARVGRNPDSLHTRIGVLARELGVTVVGAQSGFPERGQTGVGSETVFPIRAPKVLIAAGDGVSQTAFGDAWYYLERELGLHVTPVELSALGRVELDDYNVLVIPDGGAGTMWRQLGEGGANALKEWVQGGGLVMAWGSAVSLLARKELELTTVATVDSAGTRDSTIAVPRPAPPLVSPNAPQGTRPDQIPGAIFRATLDRSHWLAWGYGRDELPVLLTTSELLKPSSKGDNPAAFTGTGLLIAGFTFPNTERFVQGSVYAAVENAGRGKAVLFADDPLFRGFWRGPARLVTNALLYGTGR
ncbi:MAG TPA: M14 family zinc carboxypeptidase [Gemmatimonadales bacterium]|nr:M14 family zinc carboxypeptidase [Gemmatimonadales bacterium]